MLKFSVPTNWQKDLISKLAKDNIEELYGKLQEDIVGGGRASVVLPSVSNKELCRHIEEAHKNGLKFNYLLNSTCLDNSEWTRSWQKKFRSFLDYLVKVGIDKVTVSIPYLLELIKKKYQQLEVCVSIQVGVVSVRQAKFWEDLGADEITLFTDVNRNFPLLGSIKQNVHCKLKLIANIACLYGCPFYHYHANLQSHASQAFHFNKGFVIDYCTLRCRLIRLSCPEEFIRARWIRPEDVKIYEALGIDSLKFTNRDMKTEAICLIVKAYSNRKYSGNLLDLFSDPSKNLRGYNFDLQKIKYLLKPFKVNIIKLRRATKFLRTDEIYIDNDALDGFLQYFLDGGCSGESCQQCGYCHAIAKRVINISPKFKQAQLQEYKNFLEGLITGDLFSYL